MDDRLPSLPSIPPLQRPLLSTKVVAFTATQSSPQERLGTHRRQSLARSVPGNTVHKVRVQQLGPCSVVKQPAKLAFPPVEKLQRNATPFHARPTHSARVRFSTPCHGLICRIIRQKKLGMMTKEKYVHISEVVRKTGACSIREARPVTRWRPRHSFVWLGELAILGSCRLSRFRPSRWASVTASSSASARLCSVSSGAIRHSQHWPRSASWRPVPGARSVLGCLSGYTCYAGSVSCIAVPPLQVHPPPRC